MSHKSYKSHIAAMAIAFALSATATVAAAEPDVQAVADDLVSRHDRIVESLGALRAGGGLTDAAALKIIREHASPKMDFEQLTKRAAGKHWRKAKGEERARLRKAFRALLENTYAKVLTGYSGQRVRLVSARAREGGGVSALLEVSGGKSAEIEYVFAENKNSGEQLIADIKVEGISLVANYRRQFARVVKKSGIEGLVAEVEKIAAERAPS